MHQIEQPFNAHDLRQFSHALQKIKIENPRPPPIRVLCPKIQNSVLKQFQTDVLCHPNVAFQILLFQCRFWNRFLIHKFCCFAILPKFFAHILSKKVRYWQTANFIDICGSVFTQNVQSNFGEKANSKFPTFFKLTPG